MDDVVDAVARVLESDEDIHAVYGNAPEGVSDYPAAIVLDVESSTETAGYGGLWEHLLQVRLWVLVTPRRYLPEAVEAMWPWRARLAQLFADNSDLLSRAGEHVAEITKIVCRPGVLTYGKVEHAGIEVTLTARADLQALMGCS